MQDLERQILELRSAVEELKRRIDSSAAASPWVTMEEAARHCGRIHVDQLYAAARAGALRVVRYGEGRSMRTTAAWADAWMHSLATGGLRLLRGQDGALVEVADGTAQAREVTARVTDRTRASRS